MDILQQNYIAAGYTTIIQNGQAFADKILTTKLFMLPA